MATVRITEAELARDIHGVLAKVRDGVEVIVEQDHRPVAVIKTPQNAGPEDQRMHRSVARRLHCDHRSRLRQRCRSGHRRASRAAGAARLGLMLDSTAVVAAERQGKNARQLLESVVLETGDDGIAVSVVTVLELAHGIARADTAERRQKRQRFLDELLMGVPIQPVRFQSPFAPDK